MFYHVYRRIPKPIRTLPPRASRRREVCRLKGLQRGDSPCRTSPLKLAGGPGEVLEGRRGGRSGGEWRGGGGAGCRRLSNSLRAARLTDWERRGALAFIPAPPPSAPSPLSAARGGARGAQPPPQHSPPSPHPRPSPVVPLRGFVCVRTFTSNNYIY